MQYSSKYLGCFTSYYVHTNARAQWTFYTVHLETEPCINNAVQLEN